jgi:MinD-like ATPase involved in chromosome partitioning or flagellar assembly
MAELLDLSKALERDYITLPGDRQAEVINNTDLGIAEYAELAALQSESRTLADLLKKRKAKTVSAAAKKKHEDRILKLYGDMVKMLVPSIKPAELAKLSRANREQIVLVWYGKNTQAGEQNADPPARRRSGGK